MRNPFRRKDWHEKAAELVEVYAADGREYWPAGLAVKVPETQQRMYHAARASRLTAGFGQSNTSADSELNSSLTTLRARSRELVRDAAYAKRAKTVIVNNVIGTGIGLQAQVKTTRDQLNGRINSDIEAAWKRWARSCHTGEALHFSDFERAMMGQVFEAGEVFARKHYRPFGKSEIPFALELIEAERLATEFQQPDVPLSAGNKVLMGVEVNEFGAAQAYWIRMRHPGELRHSFEGSERLERVPASDIIHLRIIDRWPQTRGEPWMHAVARRLNDMNGYSEAEIVAARGAANYMATIETDPAAQFGEQQEDGSREIEVAPGIVARLNAGEKLNFVSPNRPNTALDPFLRYMLREVAAGANVSYESLSRDYSQSNYSSSRLALLDDRDSWRVLQLWFIRNFRQEIHREWLQQAVLSRAIPSIDVGQYAADPERFDAVTWKPRGWSWVDPTKEVASYKEAIKAGFTTVGRVIAATAEGADLEDILTERRAELDKMEELDLKFDTEPEVAEPPPQPPPDDPADDEEQEPPTGRLLLFGSAQ